MSRMWIESFSPGLTTIAFMNSSLEVRQRIRGRVGVTFRPVVVLMTFEAAVLRLFGRRVARRADGLIWQEHVGRPGARFGLVTARARHHPMRRVIERRPRHPTPGDARRS